MLFLLVDACAPDPSNGLGPRAEAPAEDSATNCEDTGVRERLEAEITLDGGALATATLGYRYTSGCLGECTVIGDLVLEGAAPTDCPDCEWSFDLGPVEGSVATGPGCAALGVTDGVADGQFDYAWGFTDTFDYYMPYGEAPLVLEDVLLANRGTHWNPVAFDQSGFGEVDWDGTTLRATWRRGGPGWE